MNQLSIGIDNGNYNTKSSEHLLYASGYTESDREFITSDMQLAYQGAYYAIGGRRMRFQQDKTKEPDTFILTLPAIAHAMKQVGLHEAEIRLGVGLPIDIFGSQKQAFRDYFLKRDVEFDFEEEQYRCHIIDCKVFAQGYAALCRHYRTLKEYTTITLVDIGGYTVDILSLREFKTNRESCGSLRIGTITLFNSIRNELQQENIILTDDLIADAIGGKIQHAEREMIGSIVERQVRRYTRELLNALRERSIDLKLPTVFAGGGAELLGERLILPEVNTVDVLDRFANAEGYKLLLGQ